MSIQVIINNDGIDRPVFYGNNAFTWNNTWQSRGTCTIPLILSPSDDYAPQIGWPINIYEINDDTHVRTCVWIGSIDSLDYTWPDVEYGWRVYTLTGVGWEFALDSTTLTSNNIVVPMACGDLVTAQFAQVAAAAFPGNPLTLGTVHGGATVPNIQISGSYMSLLTQLALLSGFVWYIDPNTATLNFVEPNFFTAPFVVDNTPGMILWGTVEYKQSRQNSRGQQVLSLSQSAAPPEVATFQGDGATTAFTLPDVPVNIVSAEVTGNVQAAVTGTFTATNASPGDTITIAGRVYTFAAALDNTQDAQVLIGLTSQATFQTLVDAINADPATRGVAYSTPTYANFSCIAGQPTGSPARTFQIVASAAGRGGFIGSAGNGIPVSATVTGACFGWSGSTLTGGMDSPASGQYVVNVQVGSAAVTVTPGMQTGDSAVITYYSSTAPTLTVGSGSIMRQSTLENFLSPAAALQMAQAILNTYGSDPSTIDYQSDIPGLALCHYVTANILSPATAAPFWNGNWIVYSVQGTIVPGKELLPEPHGHFRYTITMMNSLGVPPVTQFLNALAAVGASNTSPAPAATPAPATVTITPSTLPPLLIKDTTVGNDIADHIMISQPFTTGSPQVYQVGQGIRMTGVLRKAIASDLTVRINNVTHAQSWSLTLPAATPVNTVIAEPITGTFNDADVFTADVLASDGSKDPDGVASFQIEYA